MGNRNFFKKGNDFLWDMDCIVRRGDNDIKKSYNKRSRLLLKRDLNKNLKDYEMDG